jgi:hypothetical protein
MSFLLNYKNFLLLIYNLTTFTCRLSRNLGASNSWTPKGLPRPVMELLDLTCNLQDAPSKLGTGAIFVVVDLQSNI